MLLIFAGVSGVVIVMNWVRAQGLAHMQVRLGPMRVGPHGLLQPIADAIKLLTKEDIMPSEADKLIFWLAPVVGGDDRLHVFIVVPFGRTHAVTDMNIGILFMLGVSSLGVLGIIMAGWASNSHYPLMGALRSSAQMVTYEIAMGMAVISAVLMTSFTGLGAYGIGDASASGTLSMIGIVQAQAQQHVWFLFKFFPLGLVAFVIFAVAMVAETNRAPFDLPEAESELVAGFHTEYSGFRWSLFLLGEYAAMVAVSSIAVTLWLGGWLRPFPSVHGPATTPFGTLAFCAGCPCCCTGWCCSCSPASASLTPCACRSTRCCKIQTIGPGGVRAGAGRGRPGAAGAAGARPRPGHLLVRRQGRLLHVHVHLVPRHLPALPLRPVDEGGLEGSAAAVDLAC